MTVGRHPLQTGGRSGPRRNSPSVATRTQRWALAAPSPLSFQPVPLLVSQGRSPTPDPRLPLPACLRAAAHGPVGRRAAPGPAPSLEGLFLSHSPSFISFFFFSFSFFNNFQLSLRRAQTVFETSCFHLISYLCLFAAFYSLYRY